MQVGGASTKTFVGCMLDSVKFFLVDVKIAIVLNVITFVSNIESSKLNQNLLDFQNGI